MNGAPSKVGVFLRGFAKPARVATLAAVVGIFLFLALGDSGLNQFRLLMDMKNRLLTEREKLNESIDRLTRERALLTNPDNLEFYIRSELGYIKPGEVLFEEKRDPANAPVTAVR